MKYYIKIFLISLCLISAQTHAMKSPNTMEITFIVENGDKNATLDATYRLDRLDKKDITLLSPTNHDETKTVILPNAKLDQIILAITPSKSIKGFRIPRMFFIGKHPESYESDENMEDIKFFKPGKKINIIYNISPGAGRKKIRIEEKK